MVGALARLSMKITPTSSPLDGARTSLYCATSPEAASYGGQYFVPFGKVDNRAEQWIDDPEAVQKLWDLANNQLRNNDFLMEL